MCILLAPILLNSTEPLLNLNLTIQFDHETQIIIASANNNYQNNNFANHFGQFQLTLNNNSHHLVNLTTIIWPLIISHYNNNINNYDKKNVSSSFFAIIGIHSSSSYNITLCNNNNFKSILNGTNLGMVWKMNSSESMICLYNPNDHLVNIMILINLYDNFRKLFSFCCFF